MYETLTALCIALYYCCSVFIHAVIDKYEEQIKLKIIQTQGMEAKNAGMMFLLNTLGFNMFNWLECRIFESKNRFSGHTHRVRSVLQLQLFPFARRKKKEKSSSSLQVNICEKHINKIKREIKGWIKVFLKSHCHIWSESHFSKLPQNKLRTQILLNEITKWIFTGCLCVVMTSSQTVMAHNVPRKMGQQLSFFVRARTKVQTPMVVFFPQFLTDFDESVYFSFMSAVHIFRRGEAVRYS